MRTILVVDDEIDVCDFLKSFFEDRGFRVLTALNGSEAIRLFRKEKPDLVLLDVRMEEMDGIEALRRIKKFDKNAKVIMVTAVEEQDKMESAYKLGVVRYVTKPLVLEELEHVVSREIKEKTDAK